MCRYRLIDSIKTGKKIKMIVLKSGYTVQDIQEYLHFSAPNEIYRWFRAERMPSLDNICALSQMLGVTIDELLVLKE